VGRDEGEEEEAVWEETAKEKKKYPGPRRGGGGGGGGVVGWGGGGGGVEGIAMKSLGPVGRTCRPSRRKNPRADPGKMAQANLLERHPKTNLSGVKKRKKCRHQRAVRNDRQA